MAGGEGTLRERGGRSGTGPGEVNRRVNSRDGKIIGVDALRPGGGNRRATAAEPARATWSVAFLLTLLLHVAVVILVTAVRPFAPAPVEARDPDPIQMVFVPEPSALEEPSFFTELPEDRADEAPESADFLSNVTSRARDAAPGGEAGSLPRQEGASDAPHVALEDPRTPAEDPGESDPSPPTEEEAVAAESGPPEIVPDSETAARPSDSPLAPEFPSDLLRKQPPDREPDPFRPGARAPRQEAMFNPLGNADLGGDISLNTTAWEFAPWLQRFRRDFIRDWSAPYAYYMGIISGWHVIELTIAPDGTLVSHEVLEKIGHPSLIDASLHSLTTLAPYAPLPDDFPEEHLVLTVKLVYPQVRRR